MTEKLTEKFLPKGVTAQMVMKGLGGMIESENLTPVQQIYALHACLLLDLLIRRATPADDLRAALNAERRACATECEMCPDENWGQWMAARIMARCEGE